MDSAYSMDSSAVNPGGGEEGGARGGGGRGDGGYDQVVEVPSESESE